jgi:hypothetical protein
VTAHRPSLFANATVRAAMTVAIFIVPSVLFAQQAPLHLNPAIEKLAKGQPIIGTQTSDLSLQNCHALARLDFDYAYVDMEHGPLNFDGLSFCVAAMVDKQRLGRQTGFGHRFDGHHFQRRRNERADDAPRSVHALPANENLEIPTAPGIARFFSRQCGFRLGNLARRIRATRRRLAPQSGRGSPGNSYD